METILYEKNHLQKQSLSKRIVFAKPSYTYQSGSGRVGLLSSFVLAPPFECRQATMVKLTM